MSAPEVELRELHGIAELKLAEILQLEVWGVDDRPDNSDLMLAIQHEGGLVAGAFLGGRLLAFLFAFPSREAGVQHSHRLAVHAHSRGLGLGEKLKWYQRAWCLNHGISLVRWTYDPARRINAGLNIGKLGATAGTYFEDYYGEMAGINAGVASDRLLADWELDSPHVRRKAGEIDIAAAPEKPVALRIAVPQDFQRLLESDRGQAEAERLRLRRELTEAFGNGYRVMDFDIPGRAYLLGKR